MPESKHPWADYESQWFSCLQRFKSAFSGELPHSASSQPPDDAPAGSSPTCASTSRSDLTVPIHMGSEGFKKKRKHEHERNHSLSPELKAFTRRGGKSYDFWQLLTNWSIRRLGYERVMDML